MKIITGILFFISLSAFANNSGVINFQGMILESNCNLVLGNNSKFYGCQSEVLKKEVDKKEKTLNYENIISIENFPKKNDETKNFKLNGNDVEIKKLYNEKYSKVYFVNVSFL